MFLEFCIIQWRIIDLNLPQPKFLTGIKCNEMDIKQQFIRGLKD